MLQNLVSFSDNEYLDIIGFTSRLFFCLCVCLCLCLNKKSLKNCQIHYLIVFKLFLKVFLSSLLGMVHCSF